LALLLDPRYENIKYKVLSEEKVANALAFFKTYVIQLKLATNETEYDQISWALCKYLQKQGIFSSELIKCSNLAPSLIWKTILNFNFDKGMNSLAHLAIRLLSMPSSNALVERSFSMQKYQHSLIRNKITDEKINKLMAIKWEYNLKYSLRFKASGENYERNLNEIFMIEESNNNNNSHQSNGNADVTEKTKENENADENDQSENSMDHDDLSYTDDLSYAFDDSESDSD